MASAADARLVEMLLEAQHEELSGAQPDEPNLITAVVAFCPPAYLWTVGSSLVGLGEERTMLGARLIRELSDYKESAAALLASAWTQDGSPTFEYWMVSAYAFLPADRVVERLISAAGSSFPAIRDASASALANVAADQLPSEATDALIKLANDVNGEVRFSAIFEISALWRRTREPRLRAELQRASSDVDRRVVRIALDTLIAD